MSNPFNGQAKLIATIIGGAAVAGGSIVGGQALLGGHSQEILAMQVDQSRMDIQALSTQVEALSALTIDVSTNQSLSLQAIADIKQVLIQIEQNTRRRSQ